MNLFIVFEDGEDAVYPIPVGTDFHWNNAEGAKIRAVSLITSPLIQSQPDALPTGENHI